MRICSPSSRPGRRPRSQRQRVVIGRNLASPDSDTHRQSGVGSAKPGSWFVAATKRSTAVRGRRLSRRIDPRHRVDADGSNVCPRWTLTSPPPLALRWRRFSDPARTADGITAALPSRDGSTSRCVSEPASSSYARGLIPVTRAASNRINRAPVLHRPDQRQPASGPSADGVVRRQCSSANSDARLSALRKRRRSSSNQRPNSVRFAQ